MWSVLIVLVRPSLCESRSMSKAMRSLVRPFGDTAPYLLPVSVIAWGLLWPAVHACLFRAAAGSFRAEDARRQRDQQTPRRLDGGAL